MQQQYQEDEYEQQQQASTTKSTSKSSSRLSLDVFSRSVVYTPIRAYDVNNNINNRNHNNKNNTTSLNNNNNNNNNVQVHPSDYIKQYKTIPKSIADQSYINFLYDTSIHYHQNRNSSNNSKQYLDGKNTSGKSLSIQNIKNNIESRSITLVTGGYYNNNNSSNKSSTSNRKSSNSIDNNIYNNNESIASRYSNDNNHIKQRNYARTTSTTTTNSNSSCITKYLLQRQIRLEKKKRRMKFKYQSNKQTEQHQQPTATTNTVVVTNEYISMLNNKWNQYAATILHNLSTIGGDTSLSSTRYNSNTIINEHKASHGIQKLQNLQLVSLSFQNLIENNFMSIEWIGASVQIKECSSRKHLVMKNKNQNQKMMHNFIIIGSTTNTWKLFKQELPPNQQEEPKLIASSSTTAAAATATTTATATATIKLSTTTTNKKKKKNKSRILVVPKKGTTLIVRLPLHYYNFYSTSNSIDDHDNHDKQNLCFQLSIS